MSTYTKPQMIHPSHRRGTNFTVVAGAHAILDEQEPSRQEVQVDAKLVHEGYNKEEKLANDIALLHLEKPLVFSEQDCNLQSGPEERCDLECP